LGFDHGKIDTLDRGQTENSPLSYFVYGNCAILIGRDSYAACQFQYFAPIISAIGVNSNVVRHERRRRTPTNVNPPLAPVGGWPAFLPVGEPFPAGRC
jgi:hypothetical protein